MPKFLKVDVAEGYVCRQYLYTITLVIKFLLNFIAAKAFAQTFLQNFSIEVVLFKKTANLHFRATLWRNYLEIPISDN